MTFGIAFAGSRYVGVISDRRVTGTDLNDEVGKCGAVEFSDGLLAYTMSGLAEVPLRNFRSREWTARALLASGHGGVGTEQALMNFADIATQLMHELVSPPRGSGSVRVERRHARSSYAFAGYVGEGPVRIRQVYVVSNYETLAATEDALTGEEFLTSALTPGPDEVAITLIGSGRGHVTRKEVEYLASLLARSSVPPEEFGKEAVEIVRRVALRDPAGTVGARCSAVIVKEPPHAEPLVTEYYPDAPSKTSHTTDFVGATYGRGGAYALIDGHYSGGHDAPPDFVTSTPSDWTPAVPNVNKNAKCPCGSGKKYKSCHRRRRGRQGSPTLYFENKMILVRPPTEDTQLTAMTNTKGEVSLSTVMRACSDPDNAHSVVIAMLGADGKTIHEGEVPID